MGADFNRLGRNGTLDTSGIRAGARISAFLMIIALLSLGVDEMISAGLRKINTSSFGVSNSIVGGKINADILIAGSSRALNHYDPREIHRITGHRSYNIGLNGSQTDIQLARVRMYLAHNRKPKLLILNLDLFSFQVTHGEIYDPGQYIPYLNEKHLYDALSAINPAMWKSKVIPLYGYVVEDLRLTWIKGLRSHFDLNPTEDHFFGFNPRYSAWTGDFQRYRESNGSGVQVAIERKGIEEIDDLVKLCHDQEIQLVFVYSPEYLEMQAMTNNRRELFERFVELNRQTGTPFWDYSDSAISASRGNFYNSQHLNAGGAAIFSAELAERIKSDASIAHVWGRGP